MVLAGVLALCLPLAGVCETATTATLPPITFDAENHRLVFDRAALNLALGGEGSAPLTAAISPTLPEEAHIVFHWSTADPEIAMVSDTGATATVTALRGGETLLIAEASIPAWDVEWRAECVVRVHEPVRSINLSTGLLALRAKDAERSTGRLAYAILPTTYTDVITWYVEQEDGEEAVITFDADSGVVRALSEGTAYVVAEATSGVSARCKVVVEAAGDEVPKPRSAVAGVSDGDLLIDEDEDAYDVVDDQGVRFTGRDAAIGIRLGDHPVVLLESLAYGGAAPSQDQLAWHSSDKRVARVDEQGIVYPVKVGKAIVTVRTPEGHEASSLVTVYKRDASSIRLHTKSPAKLALGKTLRPAVTFVPTHSYAELRWSSSDSDVAAVDPGSGLITATGKGMARITAEALNGSLPNLSLTVTVSAPITSLRMDGAWQARPGETWVMTLATEPAWDVTSDTVTWTSSNPKIASVDRHTGEVTAHKIGAAVITAKAGSGAKAACHVRVNDMTGNDTEWMEWPSARNIY